jgi:hypothetical protein
MARGTTVEVVFTGDTTGFQKAAATIETRTASFGSKMGTVFGAIGGVAAAKGVFDFAKGSIAAFTDAEQSAAKLDDAFQRFPKLADTNAAALRKLNSALERKTKFDDDATASGQAVLAQFNLTGTQIQTLTPLLQDYAAKTGQDLPAAADVLGKALLGKGKALAAVGIKFKDAGSVAANFDQIIGGLRTQVGGFAEKEGATAAGKAAILKNQFGELQEKVGEKLLPVLTKLSEIGLKIVEFFSNLSPGMQTAIGVVGGLLVVVLAITKATQAWTAVQAALNVVMDANPIVLIGLAIAALVVGIIYAYQHSETFRDIVKGAFHAVGEAAGFMRDLVVGAIQFVVDKWLAAAEWIVRAAATAFGWVPGIGGKLKDAAKDMEDFRDNVNRALDGIKSSHDIKLNIETVEVIKGTGGRTIEARAAGGPVTAGRPYMVGEHGPEVFWPEASGMMIPAGGGPSGAGGLTNVTFGPGAVTIVKAAGDPVNIEDGQRIIDAISRAANRGYKLPAGAVA